MKDATIMLSLTLAELMAQVRKRQTSLSGRRLFSALKYTLHRVALSKNQTIEDPLPQLESYHALPFIATTSGGERGCATADPAC